MTVLVNGKVWIKAGPTCPLCEKRMVVREGNYGKFWGCSQYPECSGSRSILDVTICVDCGSHNTSLINERRSPDYWRVCKKCGAKVYVYVPRGRSPYGNNDDLWLEYRSIIGDGR